MVGVEFGVISSVGTTPELLRGSPMGLCVAFGVMSGCVGSRSDRLAVVVSSARPIHSLAVLFSSLIIVKLCCDIL